MVYFEANKRPQTRTFKITLKQTQHQDRYAKDALTFQKNFQEQPETDVTKAMSFQMLA